ncbi:MAG: SDR family NAD(P)-dependent oxidoreductase, partial [Planctomycetaceae bacterium]
MWSMHGKVAVVSGAAQGLGKATALALAEAGADLVLIDRNLAAAQQTEQQIKALGRRTLVSGCNVSDPQSI